jgi:ribonuclease Z
MTRLFTLLLILVAITAGSAYLKRADIARSLMERGALSAMLANPLAELGDGLHVTLCGAGGPLPDRNRSGPCVAVSAGKRMFIFDAGTGGARTLGLMRYPLRSVEAVFLTHFHSDHIDGLGELATLRWVQGNHTTPLPVYGPTGVSDIVTGFNQAYARDAIYRNTHHGDEVAPLSGHGMLAKPFVEPLEGETERVYDNDGVVIDAFIVNHNPVKPAVGYRVKYKGRNVLISGDTSASTNLEKFARNTDLLVHEALAADLVKLINSAAVKTNNASMRKITTDILDYHATPQEVAEIARDSGAGHLLYYHVVPALPLPGLEAAWLDGVSIIFPKHTLGRDGTTISLPAGSRDIIVVSKGL